MSAARVRIAKILVRISMLLIDAPQCQDRTRARYCQNVAGEADWYRAYCTAASSTAPGSRSLQKLTLRQAQVGGQAATTCREATEGWLFLPAGAAAFGRLIRRL